MIRMLIDRFASGARQDLRGAVKVAAPVAYSAI
jgi:magnesium chelatase subunit H